MNYQLIAIIILFIGAIVYIGKTMYLSFIAKKGCGTSCKCGVDFSQIETDKK